jgi:hypothetical protein
MMMNKRIIAMVLVGASLIAVTIYLTAKYMSSKTAKPVTVNMSRAANGAAPARPFDAYGYLDCLEGAAGPYQTVKAGCQDLFGTPPPQGGPAAHWSDTTTEYKLEGTYGQ